jgi:hypothetical protein
MFQNYDEDPLSKHSLKRSFIGSSIAVAHEVRTSNQNLRGVVRHARYEHLKLFFHNVVKQLDISRIITLVGNVIVPQVK